MNLMYRILPENKRTMGVSVHALVRRIPMAAGPVVGGFFILRWGEQDGVRFAFFLALVLAVIALFFQEKMISEDKVVKPLKASNPPLTLLHRPLVHVQADAAGHEKASGIGHSHTVL